MAYEFASRLETFPNYRKFETTFAGRPFVVETGKSAAKAAPASTPSSPPALLTAPSARCSQGHAQRCLRDHDCDEP